MTNEMEAPSRRGPGVLPRLLIVVTGLPLNMNNYLFLNSHCKYCLEFKRRSCISCAKNCIGLSKKLLYYVKDVTYTESDVSFQII